MENETKLCKHCKSEIPKASKVCPNCKKKQGGFGKWIVIGIVVIVLLAAVFGGGDDKPKKVENKAATTQQVGNSDNKNKDSQVTNTQEEKDIFTVGETTERNEMEVTLL